MIKRYLDFISTDILQVKYFQLIIKAQNIVNIKFIDKRDREIPGKVNTSPEGLVSTLLFNCAGQ